MHKLANSRAVRHWTTDVRKAFQYIKVIQKGKAKTFCGIWEISPRVCQDFLEIG